MSSIHAVQALARSLSSLSGVQIVGTFGKPKVPDGAFSPRIILVCPWDYAKRFSAFLANHQKEVVGVGIETASRIAATHVFGSAHPDFMCIVADFDCVWSSALGDKLQVLVFPTNWHQDLDGTKSLYEGIIDDVFWQEIISTARPVQPE